ncbi:MAG: NAD-dependent epimerase/dehydratase family protein [Reichenbachiella sp.]
MTNQKIAVTGGSGHFGTHIILKLLEANYSVKAQYYTQKPNIESSNLEWIQGNITNVSDVEFLISECIAIIHCAAIVDLTKASNHEVNDTNVLGTQHIIDSCLKAERNIRVIHISSTSVASPFPIDQASNESRPYLNIEKFPYSRSKILAEKNVLKATKDLGLDALVLRPSALFGPPDWKPSIFGDFTKKFMNNEYPAITSGGYNMIDIRDAAQTVVNSITKGQKGEIYNIGGVYKPLSKITQLIAQYSESKLPKFILPVSMIVFFEPLISFIFRARNMKSPLSKEHLYFVKNGVENLDSSKAEKKLDHNCRSTEESIKDLVSWFKENKK